MPSCLPEARERVVPAGEQLPGVRLVADVPDDLVPGRIELVEQRDAQLDDTEARADVAAGHRDALDEAVADLLGELGELVAAEALQVGGGLDGRESVMEIVDGSIWRRPDVSASHPERAKGPCVGCLLRFAQAMTRRPAIATSSCSQYTPPTPRVPPTAPPPRRGARPPAGPALGLPPGPVHAQQADVGGLGQLPRPARPSCPAPRWCRCSRARRRRSGRRGRCPRRRRSARRPGRRRLRRDAAQGARGPDQRPGLAPVDRHELRQGERPPLGLEVEPLPAHHPLDAARLEQLRCHPAQDRAAAGRARPRPPPARGRPPAPAGSRLGWRSARRTGDGWWAGRGGGRRRPCTAGRRGRASRCAPSRPPRPRRRCRRLAADRAERRRHERGAHPLAGGAERVRQGFAVAAADLSLEPLRPAIEQRVGALAGLGEEVGGGGGRDSTRVILSGAKDASPPSLRSG